MEAHKAVGMWREHVVVVTGSQCVWSPYVIWLLRRWMADMAEVGGSSGVCDRGFRVRVGYPAA